MSRLAVLNVVGLTPRLLGAAMPRLTRLAAEGGMIRVQPVLPAVTCTAQSTYLTGLPPSGHGAVANGWYDRELAEHHFWKQSNHVVQGEKLWEKCRAARPGFTCAKLFWWYNMYSSADWSLTPRPMYPADGRKVFDVYSHPMGIRDAIKRDLGPFPFPAFWGPLAGIASSEWIAAAAKWIEEKHRPDLSLVYLPHLDYNLQRLGPDDPRIAADCRAIDRVAGDLMEGYAQRGVRTIVLSEYGITRVRRTLALNRIFRAQGWIAIKEELGCELLDCGASKVFAIADHQIAHITSMTPRCCRRCGRWWNVWTELLPCSMLPANGRRGWIMRDRATWSRSQPRMRGSRITIGRTTRRRRTSPAVSISTASTATIPSSYSSIPSWPCRNCGLRRHSCASHSVSAP